MLQQESKWGIVVAAVRWPVWAVDKLRDVCVWKSNQISLSAKNTTFKVI